IYILQWVGFGRDTIRFFFNTSYVELVSGALNVQTEGLMLCIIYNIKKNSCVLDFWMKTERVLCIPMTTWSTIFR
ncbi:MAG: hypothetical protein D4Q77_01800, partial [Methanothrix sp.]